MGILYCIVKNLIVHNAEFAFLKQNEEKITNKHHIVDLSDFNCFN